MEGRECGEGERAWRENVLGGIRIFAVSHTLVSRVYVLDYRQIYCVIKRENARNPRYRNPADFPRGPADVSPFDPRDQPIELVSTRPSEAPGLSQSINEPFEERTIDTRPAGRRSSTSRNVL